MTLENIEKGKNGNNEVLVVPKSEGQETLNKLKSKDLLDPDRKIKEKDNKLIFPVFQGGNFKDKSPDFKNKKLSPIQEIRKKLDIPEEHKKLLPENWEMVGDVLHLKLPEELQGKKQKIGKAYADVLEAKTVLLQGSIGGTTRNPNVEKIYGNETETIHIENAIKYKLDTEELMFSSGNIDERIRMAKIDNKDEVIVDMFAGIGYFTLPMAVHGDPYKVYAVEINPTSHHYLRENIKINRVQDIVKTWCGDNREFKFRGADRIIMGYLHDTWKFLPKALDILENKGYIHYHTRCIDNGYPDAIKREIDKQINGGYKIKEVKKVKSYAPHVYHVVVDLEIG